MIHSWLQFFYGWPDGSIWGNVVVVTVVAPLGWIWSRTRFWPLRPLKHALHTVHEKLDAEHQRAEEHREWQHHAHLAQHRGDPPPPHPHYPA